MLASTKKGTVHSVANRSLGINIVIESMSGLQVTGLSFVVHLILILFCLFTLLKYIVYWILNPDLKTHK